MNRIIKYRWWIIVVSIVATMVMSTSLFRLEVDPDLKNYFPNHMESMVNTKKIEDVFGNQDFVILLFETEDVLNAKTLHRLKNIERALVRTKGIKRTTSLFGSNRIYGKDGIMYVEPTVRHIPETPEQKEELRSEIKDNDLVYNIVVADNFKSTAIILALEEKVNEDSVFQAIHEVIDRFPGEENIHFGGLPYLRQSMDKDIQRDSLILIPLALIIMLVFLYLVFREWRGVLLPFAVVILSTALSISFIPILGWKFSLITILVPIMLIAIANDYGIHMIAKYQEINANALGKSMPEISLQITGKLWKPILLTGLTTIAGIGGLLAHTLIPARQMALIAGIGIMMAVFLSLTFIPAILSMLNRSKPISTLKRKRVHDKNNFLGHFATFVVAKSKVIPWAALTVTLLVSIGIFFLRVDSNEENFFPEKHPVKKAAKIINSKYGGSENISVLFEGDLLDPKMLNKMEFYREEMEKMEEIDLTMSFSGVVREISKALNDPESILYDKIPPSREAVAQYMELYTMSGNPEEIEQLVDFNYEHAHLMIRINDVSNNVVNKVIDRIRALSENDPNVAAIGGYGFVRTQLANRVMVGQFYSLSIALVVIFILVSIIFGSVSAGLLGIIPLLMSVLLLFGLMGIFGIRLDVATALLSSIMIGVGVDYTIHFLWRYRDERYQHRQPHEAVVTAITTTGRGIIFNALSVIIGFIVLIFSSFTPIRFFGILVVVSIIACLVGAMLILPTLLLRKRYRFLEPQQKPVDRKIENNELKDAI
ncbi:MAG: RND family transporter [Bacteroidales bacterium]|nr:RND family transporter [Bacteroidales bacterium]